MIYTAERQGSAEWHRLRIGRITSTAAAALMTKARKAGEVSATAQKEIYRLRAERRLKKEYLTDLFQEYLDRNAINSKAMEFGKMTENEARLMYQGETLTKVTEVAFIVPDEDDLGDFWGDSPDGVIFDKSHKLVGCIEIKCPKSETFIEYSDRFDNGETLKTIEPKYHWQVCNHLAVSGAEWCDFIIYDPMLIDGYKSVRINRADIADDIAALTETVKNTILLLK